LRLYSSSARKEKILISRHYDGVAQYIYAQVFNGSSWGEVNLLASWTSANYLDAQNFDGVYLENGDFMAIYSDDSKTPRSKIWDGSSWGSEKNLKNLGNQEIPVQIVAKKRSGSNEIMAAFLTGKSTISTEYYSGSSWANAVSHSTALPAVNKKLVDFDWSPNSPTAGALIYASGNATTARSIVAKIWQANGSGSGSWGTAATSATQSSAVGAMAVSGRKGANEFQACDKDSSVSPKIICYRISFSGTSASFSNPANQQIVSGTDSGIQRSFHLAFETAGNLAINVYSDSTGTPKLKKYDPSSNSWDTSATAFSVGAYSPANIKTVKILPYPENDDMLILAGDANQDLYSAFWNGEKNEIFASPLDKEFYRHGTHGSDAGDFWFDFAWDGI
jgi:hypothetical protein